MRTLRFGGDPVAYVVPTLVDMDRLAFGLARAVVAAGVPRGCTVAIANGALPYALAVHNHVGNRGKIVTLGMSYYDFDRVRERAEVVQGLSADVRGRHVLLLDEVVDRGGTMPVAREHVVAAGAAGVWTGALVYKRRAAFRPDFVGQEIEDEWVVFPHDVRPTVEQLAGRWREAGVPAAEVGERVRALFAEAPHLEEQVELYLEATRAGVEG